MRETGNLDESHGHGGQRACHTQIRYLEFKATGLNVLDVRNKGK